MVDDVHRLNDEVVCRRVKFVSNSYTRRRVEQRALGTLCLVNRVARRESSWTSYDMTYATQQEYFKLTHQQSYYILRCTIVTWYEAVSDCTSAVRHYLTKVHNYAP